MNFLNTITQDFQRLLNNDIDEDIHMPHNHTNRNRHRAPAPGRGAPRITNPPALAPANAPVQQAPVLDTFGNLPSPRTRLPLTFDAPALDSANTSSPPQSQRRFSSACDGLEERLARGLGEPSGYNMHPRRPDNARRPPPISTEGRHRKFRPFADAPVSPWAQGQSSTAATRPALISKDPNRKLEPAGPAKLSDSDVHDQPTQKPKVEALFDRRKSTGYKDASPMSPLVEELAPLKVVKKLPSGQDAPPSPVMDEIMRRKQIERARKQEREIENLSHEIKQGSIDISEDIQPSPNFIPALSLPDFSWSKSVHNSIRSQPASKYTPPIEIALRRPSATSASLSKEVDELAAEMSDNPLSSSPSRSMSRKSAIPAGLDMDAIQAAKAENCKAAQEQKSAMSSTSSFERIPTPTGEETEHNGERRKWYKGFMR